MLTGRRERTVSQRYFAGWSTTPTQAETRDAVRSIRASKGMLISPGDDDCRSAVSFFKNPIVSPEQYQELSSRAAAKNLTIPSYPALEQQKKISAAWLVEHSGFTKGSGHGPVGISRKHALAIVKPGRSYCCRRYRIKRRNPAAGAGNLGYSAPTRACLRRTR
jgi:UDP-N-acetylmuramate dehydrogenase